MIVSTFAQHDPLLLGAGRRAPTATNLLKLRYESITTRFAPSFRLICPDEVNAFFMDLS